MNIEKIGNRLDRGACLNGFIDSEDCDILETRDCIYSGAGGYSQHDDKIYRKGKIATYSYIMLK